MKKHIIGIIGGGNMGEALIKGLIAKKLCLPHCLYVCEANTKRLKYLKEKYHIAAGDLDAVVAKSQIVILAVKPQDMEGILLQMGHSDKLFISIAAGLTTSYFEKYLGLHSRVVRSMPNMPALVGQGITGICRGRWASVADLKEAGRLLAAVGGVLEFQEKYMDAVTAVSGSGPAYIFLFVEQWIAAARSLGLSEKEAKDLVYETLLGSVCLLKETGLRASALRAKVTSKKGTTEAAMKVFFKGNRLGKLMKEALVTAKKRAEELAK